MHYHDIDEIIKKSLQESERKNEIFADQAKSRIWDAIEMSKNRKKIHWGFALALAAAVTFFLISTFLFLKLESKKEEILSLQTFVNTKIQTIAPLPNMNNPETEQKPEKIPKEIQETLPAAKREKAIQNSHIEYFTELVAMETIKIAPESILLDEAIVTRSIPEIEVPEIVPEEMKEEIAPRLEVREATQTKQKSKSKGRIKLKIGNNNKAFNNQNSLALNIKL